MSDIERIEMAARRTAARFGNTEMSLMMSWFAQELLVAAIEKDPPEVCPPAPPYGPPGFPYGPEGN